MARTEETASAEMNLFKLCRVVTEEDTVKTKDEIQPLKNVLFMIIQKSLTQFGEYLQLMGKTFQRPERMRMFMRQYTKEMNDLGVGSIGIVLLISFFIGAVICIQMKVNVASPWMPRFTTGYTTREILLLEFSSSIMCLILSG